MSAAMNPYQRVVQDGKLLQAGHIHTQNKFALLISGLDLRGKRVLDVGCNVGEMCRLAQAAGADCVRGIDTEPDYIADARRLSPDLDFRVQRADRASGNWDVVIASAVLHYCDLQPTLAQLARIAQLVVCDVWLEESPGSGFCWNRQRRLMYPHRQMWLDLVRHHFRTIREIGPAPSPDHSRRFVFHLSGAMPTPAQAILIHGPGQRGKTTMGRELAAGKGYEHLELDRIFLDWRIVHEPSPDLSVMGLVDEVWNGDGDRLNRYLQVHHDYLMRWLGARQNLDVVIEGYDAIHETYRRIVRKILAFYGWTNVREVAL